MNQQLTFNFYNYQVDLIPRFNHPLLIGDTLMRAATPPRAVGSDNRYAGQLPGKRFPPMHTAREAGLIARLPSN